MTATKIAGSYHLRMAYDLNKQAIYDITTLWPIDSSEKSCTLKICIYVVFIHVVNRGVHLYGAITEVYKDTVPALSSKLPPIQAESSPAPLAFAPGGTND